MSSKFSIEPRVAFVSQLLAEINEGTLKIPRFQRTFVWDWDQQRDLLSSVLEGLPIGAILVWSTSLTNIASYDKIGPFRIKNLSGTEGSKSLFLMDGLQRMTTLYSMLHFPESSADSPEEIDKYKVYVDLNAENPTDMFVRAHDLKKFKLSLELDTLMPLSHVFDTRAFVKFSRELPPEREDLLDKADEVVSAFKNYKIPIVPLESDDQSLVTKSFERINTRGTTMSEVHMLNALSYSEDFDLLKKIEIYTKEYLSEYIADEDADFDFVLSVLKLQLNYDIYFKDTDALAQKVNDKILEEVFLGIKKFYEFSRNCFGIEKTSQYPYKLQPCAIAYSFVESNSLSTEKLKSWFYITTYTGAFGATARNSSSALSDFRELLRTGSLNWSLNMKPTTYKWDESIVLRSARMKAWALVLANHQTEILRNDVLQDFITYKGRCFKRPLELESCELKTPGCFLIQRHDERPKSLTELSESECEAHFISQEMITLAAEKRFKEFSALREQKIYEWEVESIIKPAAETLKLKNLEFGS